MQEYAKIASSPSGLFQAVEKAELVIVMGEDRNTHLILFLQGARDPVDTPFPVIEQSSNREG